MLAIGHGCLCLRSPSLLSRIRSIPVCRTGCVRPALHNLEVLLKKRSASLGTVATGTGAVNTRSGDASAIASGGRSLFNGFCGCVLSQ